MFFNETATTEIYTYCNTLSLHDALPSSFAGGMPLALAAPDSSTAATAAATQQIPELAYTRFILPNGLTVVVHEDHTAPVVAVSVWYHVGSRSEEHTSELQSLMRISYAVFCLKKKRIHCIISITMN